MNVKYQQDFPVTDAACKNATGKSLKQRFSARGRKWTDCRTVTIVSWSAVRTEYLESGPRQDIAF